MSVLAAAGERDKCSSSFGHIMETSDMRVKVTFTVKIKLLVNRMRVGLGKTNWRRARLTTSSMLRISKNWQLSNDSKNKKIELDCFGVFVCPCRKYAE